MTQFDVPSETQAAAFDHFGGPEVLTLHTLPVPEMADDEIVLRVHTAGVGVWDVAHRTGEFVPEGSTFPMVPGSDASGTVIAAGPAVQDVAVGDEVYAYAWARPKGGMYARYAVTKGAYASVLPEGLSPEQAGALGTDGLTALSGLDTLALTEGGTLLILGASGGLGHLALQLAKRQGLRVIAVASGPDGVKLVQRLGADLALDGHAQSSDLSAKIQDFAQGGVDGLLAATGGDTLSRLFSAVRQGGLIAYPNGVQPPSGVPDGVEAKAYNGATSPEQLHRLNDLIVAGPFEVHIAQRFQLEEASQAHKRLQEHYLGKLALHVSD